MMKTKVKCAHIRIGPVAEAILASVALAGIVSVVAFLPGLTYAVTPFIKNKSFKRKQAVALNIDSLVRNGLLKKDFNKKGEIVLSLTKKGKWESGIRNNFNPEIDQSKIWDGKWRIIIFDIPEAKRHIRRELRRAVMLYGFSKLQQSVWVYPYPCDDFVKLVKSYLKIKNDVSYITAEQIENDLQLRREYGFT